MASCTFSSVKAIGETRLKADIHQKKATGAAFVRHNPRITNENVSVRLSCTNATAGPSLSTSAFQPKTIGSRLRTKNLLVCFAESENAEKAEDVAEDVEEEETEEAAEGTEEESGSEEPSLISNVVAALDDEKLGSELETAVAALTARAEKAEAEADKAKDSYIRLNADFENFRKRTANEKDLLRENARSSVLEDLLPVIDNFELAKQSLKLETEAEEKIDASYQNLYRQMVDVFKKIGLTTVETVGSPFDPEVHDAIMREPTNEVADGVIIQEFRKGFKFGEQLLRPAMVKVAMATEEVAAEDDSNDTEEAKEESAEAAEAKP
eukprot:CAMPEP_0197850932 /NCGR_PEP_ID=MMETSP1438-20131217/16815_1 /TAXON_ID=1461541 /ORGANISM="Pterosperma sp., Strain CCMP1384" /LENGTH=323 /DNA_ID=CAMNT_0043464357 /DNA_START=139 /DNA_END=1110 /DNA_ORIENTATION=-